MAASVSIQNHFVILPCPSSSGQQRIIGRVARTTSKSIRSSRTLALELHRRVNIFVAHINTSSKRSRSSHYQYQVTWILSTSSNSSSNNSNCSSCWISSSNDTSRLLVWTQLPWPKCLCNNNRFNSSNRQCNSNQCSNHQCNNSNLCSNSSSSNPPCSKLKWQPQVIHNNSKWNLCPFVLIWIRLLCLFYWKVRITHARALFSYTKLQSSHSSPNHIFH